MRPSWPPPSTPSVPPGKITVEPALTVRVVQGEIGRHRLRRGRLASAELLQASGELGVGRGQRGDRKEGRVGSAGRADGEGRDRDPLGHLHDRVERVDALQMA